MFNKKKKALAEAEDMIATYEDTMLDIKSFSPAILYCLIKMRNGETVDTGAFSNAINGVLATFSYAYGKSFWTQTDDVLKHLFEVASSYDGPQLPEYNQEVEQTLKDYFGRD